MKDRIHTLLETEKISPARFAEILGVQRSGISHILSGRNLPSLDMLTKILNQFPNLSAEWLLRGKGNIYLDSDTTFVSTLENKPLETASEKTVNKNIYQESIIYSTDNQSVETESVTGKEILPKEDNLVQCLDKHAKQIVIFYPDNTFEQFHQR